MNTKTIIFTEPCKAELVEQSVPCVGRGQVRVRLYVSSISSGTERANVSGNDTVSYASGPAVIFPRQSGYSSSGVIEEVGEGVTDLKVGDRVALAWSIHSKYNVISADRVFKIGDNVSFEEAALLHIATFPLAAIRKCELEIGESAIVMGLGILGLIAIPLLKLAGAAPIIAVDPVKEKREIALKYGADYALDPFAEDFAARAKEITKGGANVAIEVTGFGSGLDGALDCMARFGRVALLGCTRSSDFKIDYYRKVHGPGITLVGAHTLARPEKESSKGYWTLADDMNALIKLTELDRLDLGKMIEQTCSPNDTPEVYQRLMNEKSFPITQFDWRDM